MFPSFVTIFLIEVIEYSIQIARQRADFRQLLSNAWRVQLFYFIVALQANACEPSGLVNDQP